MIMIFIHIPKTGGNTFASVLYNQYNYKTEVRSLYGRQKLPESIDFENIKLIVGHHQFGVHSRIRTPCQYITMLREPVDRTISDYYFCLKFNNLTPKDVPFEGFVKQFSNRQTRWIAGEDRENLELAKKHIRQSFIYVGITELFNESLYLMKEKLGWRDISYKQYNVNEKRPKNKSVSEKQIELIKHHNQKDTHLYNWIKKDLEAELMQLNDESKKELKQIKDQLCQGYTAEYANPYDFV